MSERAIAGVPADTLAVLRDAGYDPRTLDEAITAAATHIDADRETAAVWLLGRGDLEQID